jgi:hypothetical protein
MVITKFGIGEIKLIPIANGGEIILSFLQNKCNICPVGGGGCAMDDLLYYPAFVQVAVNITNFIRRMPVGNALLVNINIYGNNFLCHDVYWLYFKGNI